MSIADKDFYMHNCGLNYNENGTAWVVQKVRFENGIRDSTRLSFTLMASFPAFDRARVYFDQFCSGLQDDEGICENQNRGHADFYRIVEAHEG